MIRINILANIFMKLIFLPALAVITTIVTMSAEETKRPLLVEETFFGSNPTAYALLRTETETTSSDEFLRNRTWIDEYAKVAVLIDDDIKQYEEDDRIRHGGYQSKLTQSTLLLDVTVRKNVESESNSAAVNVTNQNSNTALAAMLLRYPVRAISRWSPEQMKELAQNGFFYQFKTQALVNGWLVRARVLDLQGDAEMHQALGPTKVSVVEEDENCVYITFHATNPEHKQTRIFCILPAATANVRQLAKCESFCLLAGRFDTKTEALERAKSLRARLNTGKNFSDVELQVWNVYNTGYSRAFYFVVMPRTSELIKQGRVAKLQEFIGNPLPLVPSETFTVMVENLPK
jgi:hypothetical protein